MQSLLGQFFNRIKGSQEDIASEGLTYILQNSSSARKAISNLIKNDVGLELDIQNYLTQNVGEKLERPDISGLDEDGNELVIMEAKFWATLTDNQPLEYLGRLSGKGVLIFICPGLRLRPIHDELLERIKPTGDVLNWFNEDYIIELIGSRFVLVRSWEQVLGTVKHSLVKNNEQALISDIDQIIGFAHTIDTQTFLPMRDTDLSPSHARRMSSYYDLMDKIVNELKSRKLINTTRLMAVGQKYGYTRNMSAGNLALSLHLNMKFWAEHSDTPFWLYFKHIDDKRHWYVTGEHIKVFKSVAAKLGYTTFQRNSEELYFALKPLINQMEDIVIKDLANQIELLIREIVS
jgi:hypothetical protein